MTATGAQSEWIGSIVLGRYRVVRILALGGMGAVYLGRADGARGFVRPVVIKRILASYADDDEAVSMFVREARILSQLQDPGIVSVIDFGQEPDGTLVMVLEYVHGYHLGYWHAFTQKSQRKMDVDIAGYIVTRVLDALSHAHNFTNPDGRKVQIIHRDISPSNVLLDIHGNVKLVDFGIARSQGEEVDEYKTQAPRLKGKFSYMPVELFRGDDPSVQTDVYACGVMLYELLSGSNPFRGRTMAESYDKVRTLTPMTLGALRDDVSPELDAAVAKAMAQDPSDRFAGALEFANALRAARSATDETLRSTLRDELSLAYAGPLPEMLDIEPLSARGDAWRDAGEGHREPSLETVTDRPPSSGTEDVTVITDSDAQMNIALAHASASARMLNNGATVSAPAPIGALTESRKSGSRAPWLALVVGLVLIAAASAAFWMGRKQQTVQDRVVVIERQPGPAAAAVPPPDEAPEPEAAAEPAPAANPSAAAEATPPSATEPTIKPHKRALDPASTGPDPRDLTRAFSRHQGKIESCFAQFPNQVGNETLSIKFQIAETGTVQTAELSPASIAGTQLGRCLVGVAKLAHFPRQGEALAFRIPITARRVE